jgi:hypothetical protein
MIPDNENHFHIKAQLTCGAWLEIIQRQRGNVLELTVTPADGTKIEDTAWVSNGILRINLTTESMIGVYQLLRVILGQDKQYKRKKFLGIF